MNKSKTKTYNKALEQNNKELRTALSHLRNVLTYNKKLSVGDLLMTECIYDKAKKI